jgi:hypothetical protein
VFGLILVSDGGRELVILYGILAAQFLTVSGMYYDLQVGRDLALM